MDEPKKKSKILSKDVQGLKHFNLLAPLLERLHETGTACDRAGNRQLHMDQYCLLILTWLYSPILTSLRGLQQASTLDKLQKKLRVPRTSLGSLSESVPIFDPEPLKKIAQELGDELPSVLTRPRSKGCEPATVERLSGLGKTITVDAGHVFDTLVLEYLDQSLDKTNPYRVRFGELVDWSKTQLEGGLALYQADQRAQRAPT